MKVSEQECDPLLGMLPTESEGWRRAPRGAGGQGPGVEAMSVQAVVLAAGPPVACVCQVPGEQPCEAGAVCSFYRRGA